MSTKQYRIDGEVFDSQSALVERIQSIIRRYRPGQTIDMFDFGFVVSLLQLHPDAANKIGCGVASITVEDNPVYPGERNRGFHIWRTDGSGTDFSFRKCIRPTSHAQRVQRALRVAVEPQTMAFKQRYFDALPGKVGVCPETGQQITYTNCHVDHKAPSTFDALSRTFMNSEGLTPDDVQVVGVGIDNAYQDRLEDLDLEHRWMVYHERMAVLEVVSPFANLSSRKIGMEDNNDACNH